SRSRAFSVSFGMDASSFSSHSEADVFITHDERERLAEDGALAEIEIEPNGQGSRPERAGGVAQVEHCAERGPPRVADHEPLPPRAAARDPLARRVLRDQRVAREAEALDGE